MGISYHANQNNFDNKRAGGFGPQFEPGDAFLRELNGETITFRKLQPAEAPLVQASKINGRWISAAVKAARQEIMGAIREYREAR